MPSIDYCSLLNLIFAIDHFSMTISFCETKRDANILLKTRQLRGEIPDRRRGHSTELHVHAHAHVHVRVSNLEHTLSQKHPYFVFLFYSNDKS